MKCIKCGNEIVNGSVCDICGTDNNLCMENNVNSVQDLHVAEKRKQTNIKKFIIVGAVTIFFVIMGIIGYLSDDNNESEETSYTKHNNGDIILDNDSENGALYDNMDVQQFFDDFAYYINNGERVLDVDDLKLNEYYTEIGGLGELYQCKYSQDETVSFAVQYINNHVASIQIIFFEKPDFSDINEAFPCFGCGISMLLAANGETGENAMEKSKAMAAYWYKMLADPDSNSFYPYYKNSVVAFKPDENCFMIRVGPVSPDEVEKAKVDNESLVINFNDKEVLNEAYEYLSEIYNREDNAESKTK